MLVLLAGGGVLAWTLLGQHGRAHAAPGRPSPGTTGQASTTRNSQAPSPQGSPASTPPVTPQPVASADTVTLAPGVSQEPGAPQVTSFLESYFTAVNSHDYGTYSSLFIPALRPTPGQFSAGYRSTADSAATLTGLAPAGSHGLAATVTFTSHQNPADSPDGSACTDWDITLYLKHSGTGYLIQHPPAGYHASHQSCS